MAGRDFGARELKVQIFDDPASRHAAWRYEVRRLEAYLDEMHTPAGAAQYLTYTPLAKKFPELVGDVALPPFLAPFVRGVGAENFGMFVGPEWPGSSGSTAAPRASRSAGRTSCVSRANNRCA